MQLQLLIQEKKKIFYFTIYLETKSFKTEQAKFQRKLTIIPRKAKFIVWYTNSKPQGRKSHF